MIEPHTPKIEYSQEQIDALARCFLPAIQAFYECEENQRKFEEWKARQDEQLKAA